MAKQQGENKKSRAARGVSKNKNAKHFAKGNAPVKKKSAPKKSSNPDEIRLNKYIANSGMCSRRDADMHISIGSVTVNGKVITEMGYKVRLEDEVRFDGARIQPEKKTYVLLNKPKGFATTTSEGKGRTVMDLVANATNAKIKPIGRLGRGSLGLLLFTNDDILVKKFTNSKNGVERLFHIELEKNMKFEDLKKVKEGFKIKGKEIRVEDISFVEGASKKEVGIKIKNTGNTIIRAIFEHLNYEITRLDCVAIGHLTKKDLPRGHWKHLTELEINTLKML